MFSTALRYSLKHVPVYLMDTGGFVSYFFVVDKNIMTKTSYTTKGLLGSPPQRVKSLMRLRCAAVELVAETKNSDKHSRKQTLEMERGF